MTTNRTAAKAVAKAAHRDQEVVAVVELYHRLMSGRPTEGPVFLDVPITMAQAKVLFLVEAVGELRMSELVARLGTSPSTVSGLVERLVDHGLVSRRDDPADRRQVFVAATREGVALADRLRQLGVGELRALLAHLDDDELADVRRGFEALERALTRAGARP